MRKRQDSGGKASQGEGFWRARRGPALVPRAGTQVSSVCCRQVVGAGGPRSRAAGPPVPTGGAVSSKPRGAAGAELEGLARGVPA